MAHLNLTQEKLRVYSFCSYICNAFKEAWQVIRSEYLKHRPGSGRKPPGKKYRRQRMLPEYQLRFPWVLPDEADPYFAFCTFCVCRLSAKGTDLGKHEGSIKHTENAAKRSEEGGAEYVLKGCHSSRADTEAEYDGEQSFGMEALSNDDDFKPYIKQEPIVDIVEIGDSELNMEKFNESFATGGSSDADDDVEPNPNEDENYETTDTKRLEPTIATITDTHSQHVFSTVGGKNSSMQQCFTIREIAPAATANSTTAPHTYTSHYNATPSKSNTTVSVAPCQITIKKISAPIAHVPQATAVAATHPPAVPSLSVSILQQPPKLGSVTSTASVPPPTLPLLPPPPSNTVRDSFALFFDSICSSVRALPPKLAVEGKIRVMQLIGELEMRALSESDDAAAGIVASSTTN